MGYYDPMVNSFKGISIVVVCLMVLFKLIRSGLKFIEVALDDNKQAETKRVTEDKVTDPFTITIKDRIVFIIVGLGISYLWYFTGILDFLASESRSRWVGQHMYETVFSYAFPIIFQPLIAYFSFIGALKILREVFWPCNKK